MPDTRSTNNAVAVRKLFEQLLINQSGTVAPLNAEAVSKKYQDEPETDEPEEFLPISSRQSVISTPQTCKGAVLSTSKRWLTAWLKHTNTYRCHVTGTQFHPNSPSMVQYAHIHLLKAVQGKDWADTVISSVPNSVSCLSGSPDCSVRICPRHELQDLVGP